MSGEPALLVVLSGPSGAGKGTLCRALLLAMPGLRYSVSATTRPPRPGEVEGENYFFVRPDRFREMREAGEFLEWAEVYGHCYGTPRRAVEEMLARGEDVILEIDIQGALQVKRIFPQGVYIFVAPPSLEELARRITGRGADSPEAIARRLASAGEELTHVSQYDYVVVNDRVEDAVAKLRAIIVAEKCRSFRLQHLLQGSKEG